VLTIVGSFVTILNSSIITFSSYFLELFFVTTQKLLIKNFHSTNILHKCKESKDVDIIYMAFVQDESNKNEKKNSIMHLI
jgi:hypothetical protein